MKAYNAGASAIQRGSAVKGTGVYTDRLTVSGNALKLASNGATHVVAGDVLVFRAQ